MLRALLLALLLAPHDARKTKTKKAKSKLHAASGPMLLSSSPSLLNKQATTAFQAGDFENAVKGYEKLRGLVKGSSVRFSGQFRWNMDGFRRYFGGLRSFWAHFSVGKCRRTRPPRC
jgi:hypothetical protein